MPELEPLRFVKVAEAREVAGVDAREGATMTRDDAMKTCVDCGKEFDPDPLHHGPPGSATLGFPTELALALISHQRLTMKPWVRWCAREGDARV